MHFIIIGAIIFGLNAAIRGPEPRSDSGMIEVSEGRVAQILESFQLVSGRAPTAEEAQALLDDFVIEEAAYREALAMGLAEDDTVVRRRLRQKVEFLFEDEAAQEPATDADLKEWLAGREDQYRLPERRAFQQVLASIDRRGVEAAGDAKRFAEALKTGARPEDMGDDTFLPGAAGLMSQQEVASLFGEAFAQGLFAAPTDGWIAPVPSSFGMHAVRITEQQPGVLPPFDAIRSRLEADRAQQMRADRLRQKLKDLRDRYDVRIDWPKDLAPAMAQMEAAR
ncbi:MAG: peptidylprolyl isomerase [Hyphomonadaceae bacterium]